MAEKLIKVNNTTYEAKLPRSRIEIGDIESEHFIPSCKMYNFEDETSFKMSYVDRPYSEVTDDLEREEADKLVLSEAVYYAPYAVGVAYQVGDLLEFEGKLYEVAQAHTSQEDWRPDEVPALYKISTPPGVISNWIQPQGAHDAYALDVKVYHLDKVWISIIADNVWEPSVYGWEETTGQTEVHCYCIDKYEHGGFEFEIKLPDRPESNVIEMAIETEGLNFYYQPELTQEEIDSGSNRPVDMIGGYVAYHSTCGNMHGGEDEAAKYRGGKAFQIPKPIITDANDNKTSGDLDINTDLGILLITIDDNWLDNAAYPIVIDPTFGYTSIGASTTTWNAGRITTNQAVAMAFADALISKIVIHAQYGTANTKYKTAIYDSSDGSLVDQSEELTMFEYGWAHWREFDVPENTQLTQDGNYWISFWGDTNFTVSYDVLTDGSRYKDQTYGTWSTTISTWDSTTNAMRFSIYGIVKPKVYSERVTLTNPNEYTRGDHNMLAFSSDNTYLAIAHSITPFITIYKRSEDTFTKLPNLIELPTNTGNYGIGFSSDDTYLYVATSNSPYIFIYKRSGDTFTKLPDPEDLPTGRTNTACLSPDDTYLATGGSQIDSPFWSMRIYKRSGDTFTKLTDPTDLPTASVNGSCFSHDSTYLVITNSGSTPLIIYKRSGDTFTKLTDPTDMPTAVVTGVSFSHDSTYLAVAYGASPYMHIYERSGDAFTKLATPSSTERLQWYGRGAAFSKVVDTYVAFSGVQGGNGPALRVYKRSGSTFSWISQPVETPTNTMYDVSFSSDNSYMALVGYNSPYICLYKLSEGTFTKLTNPTVLPPSWAYGIAFSPDTTYLAVAHDSTPFVTIYKRSEDTFTKLTNPSDLPAGMGRAVAFSHDNTYLAVSHDTTPYITIYKRSGDTFTKLTDPTTKPAGLGWHVSFSHDSTYLAVSHFGFPRITIYKRSGDTFTKLTDPTTKPAGSHAYGTAFSPDSTYLVVASDGTPFITIYKRSEDTFTKLTDPADLPPATARGVAFSADDTYLSVAHNTTPFMTTYKRSEDTFTKLPSTADLATNYGEKVAFSFNNTYLALAHTRHPGVQVYFKGTVIPVLIATQVGSNIYLDWSYE